jgi:hypothetical protein
MGTDTTEETMSCPCGAGTVMITTSTPDHAWVSSYNVHHSVEIICRECSSQYQVNNTRIVRRSDYAQHATAKNTADEAQKQFSKSAPVESIRTDFGIYLDTLPSVAAIYRYLSGHGLEGHSIGSFRKHWRGGGPWAQQHVSTRNLPKVLGLLGRDPQEFADDLLRIKNLEDAVPDVPTVMRCLP